MNAWKRDYPFYLMLLVVFYAVPLLIRDTGSAMFLLMCAMPLGCLAISSAYGARHGFRWHFALAAAALFAPSVFLFYNSTAWVYILIFGGTALLGNTAAALLAGRRR